MTDIIAERLFKTRRGAPVAARIYAPRRMERSSEWSCKVEIEGLESPLEKRVIGVDSFQALELGLCLLCRHIDKIAATLTFLNGPEGDAATPLIVPWSFSPPLKAEVYRLIDGKIKEELDAGR
jgi:hypothetical protein